MSFLTDFNKNKVAGVTSESGPPSFYISTGNFVLNKILSGMYKGGVAQGRLAMYAGPSSGGKSFLVGNTVRHAQEDHNAGALILDSEQALDDLFMSKLGVDVTRDDYVYRGVNTIAQGTAVISKFLKSYREHKETQKFIIVVDSLDMLQTDSSSKAFHDGEVKGDQGQHAKQIKAMVGAFMHEIRDLNIVILCTKQVYQEQDPIAAKNPITAWKITESTKFAFTQIALITKLLLKNDDTKKYDGIKIKAFGLKTRLTKPFQQGLLEVPYESGMDPYAGLLAAAEAMGVVTRNGGWYTYGDKKFQESKFEKFREEILHKLIETESSPLDVNVEDEEYVEIVSENMENSSSVKAKKSKSTED